MTDPQTAADAAAESVLAFVDNLPAEGDAISGYIRGGVRYELTGTALRALLADRARMAAELAAWREQISADVVAVVAMLDGVDHYRVWLADAYDPDVPAPDPATAIYRRAHELRARFAGRLFAAGYDPEAPGVAASAAPDATGDTQTAEQRADGLRDLTKLEGPQRGSQGDAVELAP